MKKTITPSSSTIFWTQISKKILSLFTLTLFFFASKAQNCTVNAGIDQNVCFSSNYGSINSVNYGIRLDGNSGGNLSATPNLTWEQVSAPAGSNVVIENPLGLQTYLKFRYVDIPTGTYKFRLGINCQTGGRTFDTVAIFVINIADIRFIAQRQWSSICADVEDSIKIVARPLKAGEVLRARASAANYVKSSNVPYTYGVAVNGPTADSVRYTLVNIPVPCSNIPNGNGSYILFDISNGSCQDFSANAKYLDNTTLGNPKVIITKIGQKKIDTVKCEDNRFPLENLCFSGAGGSFSVFNFYANPANYTVTTLSGSGYLGLVSAGATYYYQIDNDWDTVTVNTHSKFEINYTGNGCFTPFKDTIDVFFQSGKPSLAAFTFLNNTSYGNVDTCVLANFPLSSFKFPLIKSGTIPANYSFTSVLNDAPSGYSGTLTNLTAKDTLILSGNIIPGNYGFYVIIKDNNTNCTKGYQYYLRINKKTIMPVLRDTTYCPPVSGGSQFDMNYPAGTFGNYGNYLLQLINNTNNVTMYSYAQENALHIEIAVPGTYDIRVYPSPVGVQCNDGRSDTMRVTIGATGAVSNAGTDQNILCNVFNTNLAGNGPTGFWKFLPAISSNVGSPIVIADSTNISSLVSGFINQSTYYFSWNRVNAVTGNYCSLKPDTVRIIYSGTPPNVAQSAQLDYSGSTPMSGVYTLMSTAVVPTFSVVWSQISGNPVTIVSPNSQNTNVTGVQPNNNYSFELLVTNACGTFKDTVILAFNGALPVTLLNFSGYEQNEQNIISWKSTNEINLKEYQLEYSNNALDFANIKTIVANSNNNSDNNYSTIHNPLLKGISYYRLKIIDNDGRFSYSNVLKLNAQKSSIVKLETYPNPTKDVLQVNLNALENAKDATFTIINALGQEKIRLKVNIFKGSNNFSIKVKELPAGIYFLKYNDVVNKIVKE